MIEILAAVGATVTASAAAFVAATKRRHPDITSTYDGRDELPTNPYGLPDPAPKGPTKRRTAADIGYDTKNAPEGYGWVRSTEDDWRLVRLPTNLEPPRYDGPRGSV